MEDGFVLLYLDVGEGHAKAVGDRDDEEEAQGDEEEEDGGQHGPVLPFGHLECVKEGGWVGGWKSTRTATSVPSDKAPNNQTTHPPTYSKRT